MISEENKESNVNSTINAITGLAKAVPVYDDAIQPAAKEVGKSLATVAKTINIALFPVSSLVWGFEKIQEYVIKTVSKKLQNIPEENIVTPDPAIVGPSLEALRFTGENPNLRELYASLIATSMNPIKNKNAHPGFVEIIKNLSSDEALILDFFFKKGITVAVMDIDVTANGFSRMLVRNASSIPSKINIVNKQITSAYFDNLIRLGLLQVFQDKLHPDHNEYLLIHEYYKNQIANSNSGDNHVSFNNKIIRLTDLGMNFCRACM